jgi:hypothetical protein
LKGVLTRCHAAAPPGAVPPLPVEPPPHAPMTRANMEIIMIKRVLTGFTFESSPEKAQLRVTLHWGRQQLTYYS